MVAAAAENAADDLIGRPALGRATFCAITQKRPCPATFAVARGLFPTGLTPLFAPGVKCRGIDEHFAIDYAYKRDRQVYHGGIDMPAPFGTPIIAAAAGTVVGVYDNERSHRGIQVILRHSCVDYGLPLVIFTVYAHFERVPKLAVGQRVRMGEVLGPTGNSGADRSHKGIGQRRGSGGRFAGRGGGRFAGRGGGRRFISASITAPARNSPRYAALRFRSTDTGWIRSHFSAANRLSTPRS